MKTASPMMIAEAAKAARSRQETHEMVMQIIADMLNKEPVQLELFQMRSG